MTPARGNPPSAPNVKLYSGVSLPVVSILNNPVLVSVGWKKDQQVPNPFFNHAIVGVELQKGEYVLMDPTDENTRDLLPTYESNQSFLACRPEGDRKSTRLNSSHLGISYAVFCLKKKKTNKAA